jgi:hypothetical protein
LTFGYIAGKHMAGMRSLLRLHLHGRWIKVS